MTGNVQGEWSEWHERSEWHEWSEWREWNEWSEWNGRSEWSRRISAPPRRHSLRFRFQASGVYLQLAAIGGGKGKKPWCHHRNVPSGMRSRCFTVTRIIMHRAGKRHRFCSIGEAAGFNVQREMRWYPENPAHDLSPPFGSTLAASMSWHQDIHTW